MIWVSEQTVVDQANNIHMKSVTNELEIQELEKNLAGNDISKVKKRRANSTGNYFRVEVR